MRSGSANRALQMSARGFMRTKVQHNRLRFWRPSLYQLSYTPKAEPPGTPKRQTDQEPALRLGQKISHTAARATWKARPMSPLRRRIEKSPLLARCIATVVGWYLRICIKTGSWSIEGLDALKADMAKGPVLCVLWHGRLMMIAPHWPRAAGSLSCLHDTATVGRAAGALQAYFGLDPMEMSARRGNVATSRAVMKRARAGVSIGITADGPTGPGYLVKDAPLEWVRMLQCPVYGYAFAAKRKKTLGTWDKMVLPLPFSKGVAVFAPIDVTMPRKADAAQTEAARAQLQAGLQAVTAQADAMISPNGG